MIDEFELAKELYHQLENKFNENIHWQKCYWSLLSSFYIGVCSLRAINPFVSFVVVKFFKVETNRVSLGIFFAISTGRRS